jgi:CHAT domain-containing protein/tetratricopeptide (TPR) repeat protein
VCGQSVDLEVWLIVDLAERPDLAQRVRDGTIHGVPCPHCGNQVGVDVPLLLHDPARKRVLFVRPQETSQEQGQQLTQQMLDQLAETLSLPRPDYLGQAMTVPREILPVVLDADVSSLEELETALAERPELRVALKGATGGKPGSGTDPTAELPSILRELSQPARRSDMPRRVELCQQALGLVERTHDPGLWAELQVWLGNSLAQNSLGGRAENIERAIAAYEQALEVRTRQAMPVKWAATMMNLASAYSDRIRGERAENIERAIAAYQQALEVRTRQALSVEWATTMVNLANVYADRIRGERAENIERAIAAYEQALEVMTRQTLPVKWATTMMNLANAYADRIRGERAENIECAIVAYEQALEVMTRLALPVEWAMVMMNLATVYSDRIRGKRAENIECAIAAYEQALEVMTRQAMPVEWAMAMMNLANAYSDRIQGERAENIERAIAAYEQALEVMTRQALPVEWATATMNLATAYHFRIRGERAENIERAIAAYEQALEVRTRQAMPVEWATTMMNLANAYRDRIRGERAENIERAIAAYQRALEVMTRQALPLERATTMMNLASAYADRIRGERAENIERAIATYEQALEVMTRQAMPVEWAEVTMNLATAYRNRIQGGRAENIERAIAAYEQALEVMTHQAMPVEWAEVTMNLATAYYSRIRGERAENIERAIAAYKGALEVMTRQALPVEWATTMMNLATAYSDRIRGERAENIERAIAACEQALEVNTRQAMPVEWAEVTMNLANAYSDRIRGKRAENIERAIAAYEQAMEVRTRQAMPVEWAEITMNLGVAYYARVQGERAENIERAIAAYDQALEVMTRQVLPVEWATTMMNLANAYSDRIRGERAENIERAIATYEGALEVMTRQALPDDHRRAQRNLANLCFGEKRWPRAIVALQGALSAAELLYRAAATPEARRAELREVRDLPPRLAFALSKTVEGTDDVPLQDAVLALEQNRARWLSEALALRSKRPANVPTNTWEGFIACGKRIRDLQAELRLPEDTPSKRDYPTLSRELAAAYTALDETVTRIREYDGAFMPAPTFDQVQAAVRADCPLIYFAVSPAGSVALVVTPTAVYSVHTPLTEDALLERIQGSADGPELGGYLGAYARWRRAPHDLAPRAAWFAALDETARWLWDVLMGPLVEALGQHGIERAALVPQGWLGLLPLHAAWTDGDGGRRYALDEVCFTYAPNARALREARSRVEGLPPDSLFAVDEPWPVSANPLPNSAQEVAAACEHFECKEVLGGEAATEKAVRQQLSDHAVLHFSCHGMAGFARPLQGGLVMAHDEVLTLREILSTRLERARLAVLSACETGIPGTELPDEVISLPTGLMQAGAAGVVASLWSVGDLSTMMLMVRFYELYRRDGLAPPEALRQAQFWVRDTSNGEKARHFKGFLPEFQGQRLPVHVADTLYKASVMARPEENDFEHPFYWAAFGYTGV